MRHHGEGLRRLTKNDVLVAQLQADWRQADLAAAEHAMLTYAAKLTQTPWQMVAEDVENLRRAGFSDVDILDINQIVGYFAYVNRLAQGLGVELESFWDNV
jgi:uncharacterized peroxidase-related enzyme